MPYLSPRYNGRVGVYRTNEIERFGTVGTYSFSFATADPLTSPYWFKRDTNLSYDSSTSTSLYKGWGTSSNPSQQLNCFGSSIVFTDGDVISVEVPGLDDNNSTKGRRFAYHNFAWCLEPSALCYITVFLSADTDGSVLGQASWVLNGSAVKSSTLTAGMSTVGLKFLWDRATGMSYIYSGSPNFSYNTLIGTHSMPISSMTLGATNSDPFFFTGIALSPTQSTIIRTSDNSFQGYNNGYIISSQQYNGLTGSNKDYYTDPGSSRINVKY
jgi:hypothetical protein